jgi:hypothetical protein
VDALELRLAMSISVEVYTDRAAFLARLGDGARTITFEEVGGAMASSFAADAYAASAGAIIAGEGGQYAGADFGFPDDYVPTSGTHVYAPGPAAPTDGPLGSGGKTTNVRFVAGSGGGGAVAGFGLSFIDVDFAGLGASTLTVFDAAGAAIGGAPAPGAGSGRASFLGLLAVDEAGRAVPEIARAEIVNGSGWPGTEANEGVVLDDFVFARPVAPSPLTLKLGLAQAELLDAVPYAIGVTTGERATDPRLEIRPEGSSAWIALDRAEVARGRFVARRGGTLEVRATAVVGGARITSNVAALEVRFPTAEAIKANSVARALFERSWAQTKNYAVASRGFRDSLGTYPRSRVREFGFWVLLDTKTGRYSAARPKFASDPLPPEATRVYSNVTPRPMDRIAADEKSAVYVVGLFHTHTPTEYSFLGSVAGPSSTDWSATRSNDVANLVYDYVARYDPHTGRTTDVPAGTPVTAPAMIYAGQDRRMQAIHR